jgi:dimethylaniline monooxygenase (N-oxide forming)
VILPDRGGFGVTPVTGCAPDPRVTGRSYGGYRRSPPRASRRTDVSQPSPSVAVIGAGVSGVTATKAAIEAGLDVTAFEKGSAVGGNWVYDNDNGVSSAYRSLHINTSRERMEFSDFPMPKSYPDYPHHSQVREYFAAYAERFGVTERVRFRTSVERAEKTADGRWLLTLDDGTTAEYDSLIVCNGHHWDPRWPDPAYPGEFSGEQMHAHYFRDNAEWHDKKVLVVGMGNSAMDIAVESSFVAARTLLSARRGVWIVPKYSLGKPGDQHPLVKNTRLPWRVKQKLIQGVLVTQLGRLSRFGLPEPEVGPLQQHPTVSDLILSRIAHGEVTPKPGIERLEGDSVRFTDGTVEQVDVIVWATGYKMTFPFFDEHFLSAPDNSLPLYQRVFPPAIPNLAFIGLVQPLGAVMPIAERQSVLVAEQIAGRYTLPARSAMLADIERERQAIAERYVSSVRHTVQVDFDEYMAELDRELRRGAARARSRRSRSLVPG